MRKKLILFGALLSLIIGGVIGVNTYFKIYGKSVLKNGFIYIKSTDNLTDVSTSLDGYVKNFEDFLWVAAKKEFNNIKPGKYQISEGMTNNDLVNLLRSGQQIPVKISFNNQHTLEKLAGKIAKQIEADSTSLIQAFTDRTFLKENNITKAQMLGYFIPNTYELFWNTSAEQFRSRMWKESKRFWNENRLKKAKALNMTPNEVMALASIVQKETPKPVEQPRVAGLYLNRIKIGMPLQADPTILYVLKQLHGQDYVVKRVLYKDLKIKSPYNTYLNKGLPPSLIAMPDITAIDAILNYEKHNYLYMCVDIDNFGYHLFANSLKQHNKNARKYQRWLNSKGVNR